MTENLQTQAKLPLGERWIDATVVRCATLLQAPWWLKWAPALLAGVAALGALAVALATVKVLLVPYPVETMENGMAEMAERAAAGLPIYAEPSLDYIAMPYGPLGPRVASWLMHLPMTSLLAMRTVNAGGIAVAVVLLYLLARTWNLPRSLSIFAASWLLLSHEMTGYFFGVGKSDGLMLALIVGSMFAVVRGRAWPSALLAGALLGLATAVKQSGLPYALVLAAVLALTEWRRGLAVLVGLVAVAWLLLGLPVLQCDRWLAFYLFEAPAQYPHVASSPLLMPRTLLARDLGIVALALATPPWLWLQGQRQKAVQVLAVLLAGCIPSLLLLTQGTYANSLIPAAAVLGVVAMVGLQLAMQALAKPGVPRWCTGLAWAGLGLQLLAMIHNPQKPVPTAEARSEWQAMVDWIRAAPGGVALPDEPYTARLAGQKFMSTDACVSVLAGAAKTGKPHADRVVAQMLAWIDQQRPAAVVTTFYRGAMGERPAYTYVGALNGLGGWDRTVGGFSQQWHVFVRRDLSATASATPVMNRLLAGETVGWPVANKR